MIVPLLTASALAISCSDPVKFLNSDMDRNHFAGNLQGKSHDLSIEIKASKLFHMNLGGHVIRGPINTVDYLGDAGEPKVYTRVVYGNRALIAVDVASWTPNMTMSAKVILDGNPVDVTWKSSFKLYDDGWWFDADANVFNDPVSDAKVPDIKSCASNQILRDKACFNHQYYRAIINLDSLKEEDLFDANGSIDEIDGDSLFEDEAAPAPNTAQSLSEGPTPIAISESEMIMPSVSADYIDTEGEIDVDATKGGTKETGQKSNFMTAGIAGGSALLGAAAVFFYRRRRVETDDPFSQKVRNPIYESKTTSEVDDGFDSNRAKNKA